ncbi:MAG: hypothetical protein IKA76_02080 [Clostridia bacterium]|nr:hypothetical protein [Clostridia bacterium]
MALAVIVTVVGTVIALNAPDQEAPVIQGPEGDSAVVQLGQAVSYKSLVSVTDDGGDVELSIDQSRVKLDEEGSYDVIYTATDEAGNSTRYVLRLVVKSRIFRESELMELVAAKAEELELDRDMTKTELVLAIYDYVNSPKRNASNANIKFTNQSNTPNQQGQKDEDGNPRKTRRDWKTDWVEEAVRTLEMDRMEGDCYTYYAVSKAFFEYFGIENVGIQRAENSDEGGTHFWSAVKVEEGWYYYDATRLAGKFGDKTNNGCLITEEKLESYRTSKGGEEFYTFDKPEDFPTISKKPLSK